MGSNTPFPFYRFYLRNIFILSFCIFSFIELNAQKAYDYLPYLPKNLALKDTILQHDCFALSYSLQHKNPRWTIYKLYNVEKKDTSFERTNKFVLDPKLTVGSATNADYSKSGYDKGHLVPAEDMSYSQSSMSSSFYLTNMSPQLPELNRGSWKKLENQVRNWSIQEDSLVVISGSFLPEQFDKKKESIGEGVFLPSYFFKIILSLKKGKRQVIAFVLPQERNILPLSYYSCTLDDIEKEMQVDFFPQLNDVLKANQIDLKYWNLYP